MAHPVWLIKYCWREGEESHVSAVQGWGVPTLEKAIEYVKREFTEISNGVVTRPFSVEAEQQEPARPDQLPPKPQALTDMLAEGTK